MCTNPSWWTPTSTKAPNSATFVTTPSRTIPGFIRTLEARSKVDGIADYRKDRELVEPIPGHQITGGKAHTHTELRQIAAQAKEPTLLSSILSCFENGSGPIGMSAAFRAHLI
jgi:hypothetical protein